MTNRQLVSWPTSKPAAGLVCVLALLGPGQAWAQRRAATSDTATLLKDYALATCLQSAFPQIADPAGAAAGAYVQFGSHSPEAYRKVGAMAAEWLKRDYPSFRGADLSVMKCIDFAASREVDTIARHPTRY